MRYLFAFLLWSFAYVVIAQVDCPNTFDNNDDGAVTINDLLDLLVVFGDSDSDSDGIWDSVDACVNLSACNYAANPTETCVFIDALGVCGGDCLGDADGDGLCDDVDDCVGEVDECGVCNGPGATEVVIESITLLYDSVYLPQLAAWYVYEYDADTAFTYVCPNLFQSCGDLITHEGYDYSTVLIGGQCWFSENCRYLPSVSPPAPGSESTPFYYVYGYDGTSVAEAKATSNYVLFGALYNWPAAMGGACPSGWHIPTDSDWTHVTNLFGGEMVAGDAMKSNNYWNDGGSNGGNGSNLSGFNGRPGGLRNFNNDVPGSQGFFPFSGLSGYYGDFWSSTPTEMTGYFEGTVWGRVLNYDNPEVMRNVPRKHLGYSARCVLD